ncbi:MAG: hypothetical protein KBC22_02320, partial [Candidatus Pacebacteria bacterium]|nr:hypothetical protein [Candidatus Paceibacterota bacterium]
YVAQIIDRVIQAVLGNVGSIIIFRVGGDDAVKLAPEVEPTFEVKDMIKLGVREFYIKMTIDGEAYEPFSAATLDIYPPPYASNREKIREISRKKYTVTKDTAKKLIEEEEKTIIRSAQEKAIISGGGGNTAPAPAQNAEPLI